MTIILPGELEEMIQHHVDQGHYPSAVEVVRAALTLLGEQEQRDLHEDQNGDSAIEGQQTMTDQPDPQALLKWFEDVDRLDSSEHQFPKEMSPLDSRRPIIDDCGSSVRLCGPQRTL